MLNLNAGARGLALSQLNESGFVDSAWEPFPFGGIGGEWAVSETKGTRGEV